MEVKYSFVFQADSDVVNEIYDHEPNCLIEYNNDVQSDYCILYFSSNNLYYPNNELAFREQLVKKNKFEWYNTRIDSGKKHIFLRDIKKQWYLSGVNKELNTLPKLYEFLKKETAGYKIITIGSSAGGFAAVILGQLLVAERIYTFNGQFEILSLLKKSTENIDPIIFRYNNSNLLPYYNSLNFIKDPSTIYYFQANKHPWDIEQAGFIKNIAVNKITFKTSKHGVPFLKSNLPTVLNMPVGDLNQFKGKVFNPIIFSIKVVGILKTLEGLKSIYDYYMNKVYIHTILKVKIFFKKEQ